MSDIATIFTTQGVPADWMMTASGLQTGSDLATAVILSLFSDLAAGADDVIPDGSGNPRGWWGNAYLATPIGSKLWLLTPSKQTTQVLQLAQSYASAALAWMLTSNVATSVTVTASYPFAGMLGLQVIILEPGQRQPVTFNFQWAWRQLQGESQVGAS